MAVVVVDASVVVNWFHLEPDSSKARALFSQGNDLVAPNLALLELANALRRIVVSGTVSAPYAEQCLVDVTGMVIVVEENADLILDALRLALSLKHPIYDCIYLALAQRLNARLVSADVQFIDKLVGTPDSARVIDLAAWV